MVCDASALDAMLSDKPAADAFETAVEEDPWVGFARAVSRWRPNPSAAAAPSSERGSRPLPVCGGAARRVGGRSPTRVQEPADHRCPVSQMRLGGHLTAAVVAWVDSERSAGPHQREREADAEAKEARRDRFLGEEPAGQAQRTDVLVGEYNAARGRDRALEVSPGEVLAVPLPQRGGDYRPERRAGRVWSGARPPGGHAAHARGPAAVHPGQSAHRCGARPAAGRPHGCGLPRTQRAECADSGRGQS
jgi:hypothetical protein